MGSDSDKEVKRRVKMKVKLSVFSIKAYVGGGGLEIYLLFLDLRLGCG